MRNRRPHLILIPVLATVGALAAVPALASSAGGAHVGTAAGSASSTPPVSPTAKPPVGQRASSSSAIWSGAPGDCASDDASCT